MKLLACCIIIIANISNNGKASLDSITPDNLHNLLDDTTLNSDKSCYRPCKFNVKPRRCLYDFKIEAIILQDGKPAITVNGMTPGPPINVCVNDIIVVKVHNKIPGEDIAVHWHGVDQKGTPYMDGVPMITQCPIGFGSTYKYAFIASTPGTFFYHADSVLHQSDGLYGSLIVNQPQPLEPHSSLYDYDRSKEHTLLVAARFPQLLTGSLEDLTQLLPQSLVINSNKDSSKLYVMPGFTYRFRLINAIAVDCPIFIRIEQHEMMAIASDGRPVKPMSTEEVLLYPGERMDIVVRASQASGGYWTEVRGAGVCAGLAANAMFLYSGFNYTSMLQDKHEQTPLNVDDKLTANAVYGQKLEALQDVSYDSYVKTVYLAVDRNVVAFNESDNDFRYIIGALPKKPFYPSYLSLRDTGVVQINSKNFLYPNAPILLRPRDVRSDICIVGKESKVKFLECVQILTAHEGEVLEIALVNEGFGSNDSYTFHMHGLSMQVITTWQNPMKTPISKQEFNRLLKQERTIVRNFLNPVSKDTVVVPNKGFVIVRIRPDRGGSWLLECRHCALSSLPAAILINVPTSIPKVVIDSMPRCGTYKPADVLLT